MDLKNTIKGWFRPQRRSAADKGLGGLHFAGSTFSTGDAMKLSAVYRCVTCISDAVAQLPLELFRMDSEGFKTKDRKDPLYGILNAKPNARMTRYTFMSLLVQNLHLNGNFYAYILRDREGKVSQLVYIPSGYVTVVPGSFLDQAVRYQVVGMKELVPASDMIHIINQTIDGVTGVSTLYYAAHTLGLANDAEKHARNFFASGCSIAGIIKSISMLRKGQGKEIKDAWMDTFKKTGPNGVMVVDADIDFKPVTINPVDAQLLQTREFNVVDICRFFGVSPVKAFDLSKSSYSTVEATNIGFLTDTLAPLLEKIELEFETKLFGSGCDVDVRFDVSQLLRADKASLANYYRTLFTIGAIAPNEIRREIDLPKVEGGDNNFVQVNLTTIEKAAAGQPTQNNNNNDI